MVLHPRGFLLFVALMGLHLLGVKALRHHHRSFNNNDNDLGFQTAAAKHFSKANALHRVLDGEEPCVPQLDWCGVVLATFSVGCEEDDLVTRLLKLIRELLDAFLGSDAEEEMCQSLLDECLDMVENFSCLAPTGAPSTAPANMAALTATATPVAAPTTAPVPITRVSDAPASPAPVSDAPVTSAPVSNAPVSLAPVSSLASVSSSAPITPAPVSDAPVTSAPVSNAPATAAPASAVPVSLAPVTTTPSSVPSLSPSISAMPSEFPTEDIQCVTSEEELRLAVESSSEEPSFPTQIGICSNIMVTDAITLDQKAFEMFCALEEANCQLNAKNMNRIFFGAPAVASFSSIDFVNGDAEGGNGGALYLIGNGSVDFIDSRFINNRASRGGVMFIDGSSLSVSILNCLLQRNQATVNAGAIYFDDGSLSITDSTFRENTAFSNGGSVYMKDGILNITNDFFIENIAVKSGGALFFDTVNSVTISDSAFIDNKANSAALPTGGGGAITAFLGDISLANTVFNGNTGSNGFDIWVEDDSDPVNRFGTFISCNDRVTFCNGLDGYDEFADDDVDSYPNSDCLETGITGIPGEGPCTE